MTDSTSSTTVAVGDVIAEQTFTLSRDTLVRYAGASGDFNPIHYRDDIAQSVGLPGVLAHGMLTMGLAVQPVIDWLGQSSTALPSVLAVHIWATFGMALVIFIAGFSTLDQQLLDAARIDGANLFQTIWYVIIPGLSQTIQFVFVTTTIGMLTGLFGLLYTMTAGGPGAASYLPEFLIWKLNGEARPALASAASVFLLLIVLVIGLIQIRVLRHATKES